MRGREMTREEAIEELKILKEDYWDDDGYGHETKQYDDTMLALDMAIKALEQEPTTKNDPIDYYRAFKIACDLLNGSVLYGIDADRIYEIMMAKDGIVSSYSYESYILNNLQELDKGQYASEPTTKNCESCRYYGSHHEVCNYCYKCSLWTEGDPTTKNDLAVDCISRKSVIEEMEKRYADGDYITKGFINSLPSVTPQEQKTGHCKDCKWWKDSNGAYRRGVGAESQCPINRREVFEGNGYCYMFEPQESEEDK